MRPGVLPTMRCLPAAGWPRVTCTERLSTRDSPPRPTARRTFLCHQEWLCWTRAGLSCDGICSGRGSTRTVTLAGFLGLRGWLGHTAVEEAVRVLAGSRREAVWCGDQAGSAGCLVPVPGYLRPQAGW